MRLLTVTSIAALVISIAVLVFVLGLYAELEKSEPTNAIGNQPPSSEEICISAENRWNKWGRAYPEGEMSDNIALEFRVELFKSQVANACFK